MKDVAAVARTVPLGVGRHRFWVVLCLPLAALALAQLLPTTGAGAGIRIAAAAAVVLLVPGAVLVRALGMPAQIGVALAAALVWSCVILFAALLVTFLVEGSLTLTLVLVAAATLACGVFAARRPEDELERTDVLSALGVAVLGLPLAVAAWLVHGTVIRDGLFHMAYARKLAELPRLESLESIGHFADGGLHPGYAFPLWHGALASVARLGGVDVADVVLRLGPVTTPLALVVAYGAGTALFRSSWGGLATAFAWGALSAFRGAGVGVFMNLADPASATRGLLLPALLALVFAFVRDGGRRALLSVAAAAFVLAVVHPNYAPYAAVPLAGFLLARLAVVRLGTPDVRRLALVLAAILVPSALFILWLWPVVSETNSFRPGAVGRAQDLAHYVGFFVGSEDSFRIDPTAITRRGGLTVAALLAIPLAAFAGRRLWAALVLGGSLVVFAILLLPPVFTVFADLSSLSQARRLIGFLPLPFALAGAAVLLGRFRIAGVLAAAGAGLAARLVYQGETTYRIEDPGPGWPVWVAVAGGVLALAYAVWRRPLGPEPGPWAAAATAAFVLPFAVGAALELEREPPDRFALTGGLVAALRLYTGPDDVVIARPETQYRVVSQAPVHVVAVPRAHTIDTRTARPRERLRDTARFFAPETTGLERREILDSYGASWLVVDLTRTHPPEFFDFLESLEPVYRDDRYVLLWTGS